MHLPIPISPRVVCISMALLMAAITPAKGDTIYVDADAPGPIYNGTSWANAFADLQAALAVTSGDDEVWVANGTYKPTGGTDRNATFQLPSAAAIYGGFAGWETNIDQRDIETNTTTLSGDLGDNDIENLAAGIACMSGGYPLKPGCEVFDLDEDGDVDGYDVGHEENSYNVVTASGTNAAARLDGFTITAGRCDWGEGWRDGAGVLNDGGNLTVTHCTFRANYVARDGGAVYNSAASPIIIDCLFDRNRSDWNKGGAIYNGDQSHPRIENCQFTQNSANLGAGIYSLDSKPTIIDCIFSGNYAYPSGYAGIANDHSDSVIVNCVFTGNYSANRGACVNDLSSHSTITNCTFVGNSVEYGGGAIRSYLGSMTIENSIFWANTGGGSTTEQNQISQYDSSVAVGFSCIEGLDAYAGNGNIGSYPDFVNAIGPDGTFGTPDDDVRLTRLSPCTDAGDNDADTDVNTTGLQPIPTTDLDGRPRFFDDPLVPDSGVGTPPIVDMGAYEYQQDCNSNGIMDSADIIAGTSEDFTSNGIPDECEPDCNGNGLADSRDIAEGTSDDCQPNSVPDQCDIAAGTSVDLDQNGIPDECVPATGDYDEDGDIDLIDYNVFLFCLQGGPDYQYPTDHLCLVMDGDNDGDVDLSDFATFQRLFTGP